MKLKDQFLVHTVDDTQYLVPLGGEAFSGIVRSNRTAAFIVDCLKEDTSEDAIVDAMCRKYDAPRAVIADDVHAILESLRRIHAIEE